MNGDPADNGHYLCVLNPQHRACFLSELQQPDFAGLPLLSSFPIPLVPTLWPQSCPDCFLSLHLPPRACPSQLLPCPLSTWRACRELGVNLPYSFRLTAPALETVSEVKSHPSPCVIWGQVI